jgi:hypothetical protein
MGSRGRSLIVGGAVLASAGLVIAFIAIAWHVENHGYVSEIVLTGPQYSALVVARISKYVGWLFVVVGLALVVIGVLRRRRAKT